MKNHISLTPPLEQIAQRLFGVTDGLIEAVQRGDASAGISEAVRGTSEWAQYHADIEETSDVPGQQIESQILSKVVPDHIRELIQRRVDANSLSARRLPASGQIVRIEKIVTPRPGQLDAIMQVPLYVLLDVATEIPVIWHGWLVSAETDYASWWDFVLQEQDEPFDPEAAMVQLWNPVRLYLPMASRVVGSLTPTRLQSVRALAADFVAAPVPSDVQPWPGRVASRITSTGLRVTTGSPLAKANDERAKYQDCYFNAAEAIREPARFAMRAMAAVPDSAVGSLFGRLIAAAGRAAEILLPEPRVAIAMSAESPSGAPDLSWPNTARLRILELTNNGEGRMEVSVTGSEMLTIEIRRGSELEEVVRIAPGNVDAVSWDQDSTELALITATGRKLELNLREIR